jgi:hypothetical protein
MSVTLACRIRRLCLAAFAATAATVPFTSPADAAVGKLSAKLEIKTGSARGPKYVDVKITGIVPMSQKQAQGLIDSGHRVTATLWGEDEFSDDLLWRGTFPPDFFSYPGCPCVKATSKGLEFKNFWHVYSGDLDEDSGLDEVYAGIRVIGPTYASVSVGETNSQYGHY